MAQRFHKKRNDRYFIALNKIAEVFKEKGGWDLLTEIKLQKKDLLSAQEELVTYQFQQLARYLTLSEKRSQIAYKKFNRCLRKVKENLESLDKNKEWHKRLDAMITELCVTKYHRTHFYSFGSSLLKEMFTELTLSGEAFDYDKHFDNYSFHEEAMLIERSKPAIHFERDFRIFDEHMLKRAFDSHQYNLPFLLYTMAFVHQGKPRRIKMVRMACPTKESWFQKPKVITEFKVFLNELATQSKNHLYINKQKTWGEEGRRSDQIIGLEKQFSNFYCVCLPSDGDFYNQKGRFEKVSQVNEFICVFDRMLRGKLNSGYYHLPKKWVEDESFCKGLRSVIEDVHHLYFESKEELSPQERHLFIDICYTHLIVFFLKYMPISSMNITCRDGIDRAGCEQTKLLYYLQLSQGVENQLESKKQRQFVQHIPVYLAKSRPIIEERRLVLQKVFALFSDEIKEKIWVRHQSEPLVSGGLHFANLPKNKVSEE